MANSVRLVYQLQLIGIDFPDPYAEKDCLAPFSLRKEGESWCLSVADQGVVNLEHIVIILVHMRCIVSIIIGEMKKIDI